MGGNELVRRVVNSFLHRVKENRESLNVCRCVSVCVGIMDSYVVVVGTVFPVHITLVGAGVW